MDQTAPPASTRHLRIITTEEHFLNPAVGAANHPAMQQLAPGFGAAYDPESGLPHSPTRAQLADLTEARLADMDAHGIDMQVVSSLSTQLLPGDVAVELTRQTNDILARAVAQHPTRLAGFAALPTTVPDAAPDELRRAMGELGFVGTLIHGRSRGQFLSHPDFEPLLATAEELHAPIYLHPAPPPASVREANFTTDDLVVGTRLDTAAWGWHNETGIHFLQMLLAGVFDRHPDLQIVLGHWGEMVPWYMERLDEALPQRATRLERPISDYLRHNAWITPSGMFSQAQLDYIVRQLGTERLIMSVDYPFVGQEGALGFLQDADLAPEAREAFAHGNAERLFGIA